MSKLSRRSLIKTATVAGAAIVAPSIHSTEAAEMITLKANDTVLFQGDSITDVGRDKKRQAVNDPASLGRGYPSFLAGELLADHADLNLRIHNRGISGNKVPDLDKRWKEDCIDLKPAVLSILIGVNDIWHKLSGKYDGTPEVYRDGFTALLERTEKALPKTKIVICEPFVLRCGAVNDTWFPEFETRRAYAEEVAKKFGTVWVPFQDMFTTAAKGTKPEYWLRDGVHPTHAGHALMAKTWRETVGI